MKILEIIPHVGVGPIKFGMKSQEVQVDMKNFCGPDYDHSENDGIDYFFKSALEVSYDKNGCAEFIGTQYYTNCGCRFTFSGIDPFDLSSNELFEFIASIDKSSKHVYNPNEYCFKKLIITLWSADEQYDYMGGETRPVYGQVGIGNNQYLEDIKNI